MDSSWLCVTALRPTQGETNSTLTQPHVAVKLAFLDAKPRSPPRSTHHFAPALIRGHSTGPGPLADRLHFFRARHAKRPRALNFGDQNFRRQLLLRAERRVQAGDDGLLDLRAGKSVARHRQLRKIERARIPTALFQMQPEERRANLRIRQIHKEDLVEAPLA